MSLPKSELLRRMLLIRRVEERIKSVYHLREMRSPPHLYMGHEAIAVGVCATLRKTDLVFPYYRSHGWYLAKGGDLNAMMSELYGRANGCSGGWGGSMHLIDQEMGVAGTSAIVAGTIPHAAGAALTFAVRGQDSVAVSSFGDGAVEEGVFYETLNFASLRKLPVIFVCENNLYATNTHIRERQAQPNIWKHGKDFEMAAEEADGNDVLAVVAAAERAVARARAGEGPTLLVMHTYRLLEHCGINEDFDLGYRSREEVAEWAAKGPLVRAKDFATAAEVAEMEKAIQAQIEKAFEHAKGSAWPVWSAP